MSDTTTSPEPLSNAELFGAMQKLVEIIYEEFRAGGLGFQEYHAFNPLNQRSADGLFLAVWSDVRCVITSPWGSEVFFTPVGPAMTEGILQRILARTDGKFAQTIDGVRFYSLHRIDDIPLPEPSFQDRKTQASEFTVAKYYRMLSTAFSCSGSPATTQST